VYLMYVDESGDGGIWQEGKNSPHFILSGVIVHEDRWRDVLEQIKLFRLDLRNRFGLSLREEIHAAELIRISGTDSYRSIRKSARIVILRTIAELLANMGSAISVISISINKKTTPLDTVSCYHELAWKELVIQYEQYLRSRHSRGIIIADDTDETLIRMLLRRMRVHPEHGSDPIEMILEDPFLRDSKHSYLVQMADVVSHLLYRQEYPKGSLKKYGLHLFYQLLEPVLWSKPFDEESERSVIK